MTDELAKLKRQCELQKGTLDLMRIPEICNNVCSDCTFRISRCTLDDIKKLKHKLALLRVSDKGKPDVKQKQKQKQDQGQFFTMWDLVEGVGSDWHGRVVAEFTAFANIQHYVVEVEEPDTSETLVIYRHDQLQRETNS